MGKLSRPDIFEAVFWLLISVIFFVVSFSFNQPIEIYKFGATGWPRVILFLMALVCLGNFYYAYSKGSKAQEGRVGAKENDDGSISCWGAIKGSGMTMQAQAYFD